MTIAKLRLIFRFQTNTRKILFSLHHRVKSITPPSLLVTDNLIGDPHAFFKLSIGKSWYKQIGPAQIGPIHPPPTFSHHQAITRTITNQRFEEGVQIPYKNGLSNCLKKVLIRRYLDAFNSHIQRHWDSFAISPLGPVLHLVIQLLCHRY